MRDRELKRERKRSKKILRERRKNLHLRVRKVVDLLRLRVLLRAIDRLLDKCHIINNI